MCVNSACTVLRGAGSNYISDMGGAGLLAHQNKNKRNHTEAWVYGGKIVTQVNVKVEISQKLTDYHFETHSWYCPMIYLGNHLTRDAQQAIV